MKILVHGAGPLGSLFAGILGIFWFLLKHLEIESFDGRMLETNE